MSERLAIFDIDGTLVPGDSSEIRFVRYLWRERLLGPRQLLAFAWFCVRYSLRFGKHVMQKNKAWLSGMNEAEVRSFAERFTRDTLIPVLYKPVVRRLEAHQAAGDTVVLLSGTPQFLAEALARELGVEAAYGALCCSKDEIYAAAPPERHPYGRTKLDGAQALAEATGLRLSEAIAYGDSVHDAHLFHVVAEAVVVQPDDDLHSVATGQGWEILPG